MKTSLRTLALGAALVAAVALGSTLRLGAMDRYLASRTLEDVYYLPPADWLEVLSLGHREAAASGIYPLSLVYFGRGFGTDAPMRYVLQYAKTMLELDPDFQAVYRLAPIWVLYRKEKPTREEIESVADYVREGARRFPDDGGMAWNAGATLAYEITQFVPRDEAEKYEAEAQPYFARAIELGAAPEWMVLSTADKLSKLGQKERAVEQLLRLLPTIDDEATRLLMIQRLEELRAEADYEGLVQTLETLSAKHQAEFPYVPFDFYLVLGPAEISAPFPDALLDLLEREPRP